MSWWSPGWRRDYGCGRGTAFGVPNPLRAAPGAHGSVYGWSVDFRVDFGSILGLIYYEKSGNIWLIMGIEATTMDDYMDTPFFASIFDYERSIGVHFTSSQIEVPSGKSQFFMGKSTISMAIFNSYICMFTRPGIQTSSGDCWNDWLRHLSRRDARRFFPWGFPVDFPLNQSIDSSML